jgi:hypothetical protein
MDSQGRKVILCDNGTGVRISINWCVMKHILSACAVCQLLVRWDLFPQKLIPLAILTLFLTNFWKQYWVSVVCRVLYWYVLGVVQSLWAVAYQQTCSKPKVNEKCAKFVAVLRPREEVPWIVDLTVHETTRFFLMCMILYSLLLYIG